METVFYIIAKCVRIVLDITFISMAIRMILPIFADVEDNRLYIFSVAMTEPFVAPVRFIMDKLGVESNLPIDMGFFVTYLILSFINIFLPAI